MALFDCGKMSWLWAAGWARYFANVAIHLLELGLRLLHSSPTQLYNSST